MVGWTINVALGLLATAALTSALFPRILDSDDAQARALKKAYQSWDYSGKVNHDIFSERKTLNRVKRDASLSVGNANSACQMPGYTGQHCEFPICTEVNKNFTVPTIESYGYSDTGLVTDLSPISIIVDDSMTMFEIQLTTSQNVQPTFKLQSLQGQEVVMMDFNKDDISYEGFYSAVPSGTYYINVSTALPIQDGFQLFYHVRSKTALQTNVGFVRWSRASPQPERTDYPDFRVQLNELAVAILKPHGLRRPGALSTIAFYKDNVLVSRPMALQTRYGCEFEYYFEGFYCRDTGHYVIKVDGIDFMGNNFRRVSDVFCEVGDRTSPSPSVTTTPQPIITSCSNGGSEILYQNQTKECFCPDYFTGATCEKALCLNGGTSTGSSCVCRSGYTGNNCQDVQCLDNSASIFYNHPMLVLVVRVSQSMNNVVGQLIEQLGKIKALTITDPSYLEKIAVLTFNGRKTTFKSFESFTDTINFFLTQNSSTATSPPDCEDYVLSATYDVLFKQIISYRSPIYVFTDSLPNDPDMIEKVFNMDSWYNSPIYFTLVQQTGAPGCGDFDIFHENHVAMQTLAKTSSGMVFLVNQTDLGQLFYNHMTTTFYRSHLLRSNDLRQCGSQNTWQTISVDETFDNINIVATAGSQLTLILSAPDGTNIAEDHPYLKPKHVGSAFIWHFRGAQSGQWAFQIVASSPTACSYRAYSNNGFINTSPDIRMFYGWTSHLTLDAPFYQPVFREDLSLAVHLEGYGYPKRVSPERVSAELVIWATHDDKPELVFAANGVWRDKCDHQIVFPSFTCNHADEDLYFSVYVRSSEGRTIQRAGKAVCVTKPPTHKPLKSCMNGGIEVEKKCVCTPFWEGKNCETRKCLNGGTSKGATCQCAPGHLGKSCEITTCIDTNPDRGFNPQQRSMLFVIDTTMNNFIGVGHLHKYLPIIIRDIHAQNADWISKISIMGFNSTKPRMYFSGPSSATDAIGNALTKLTNEMVANNDYGCEVQTWQTLKQAELFAGKNDYIFLFQAGIPATGDLATIVGAYDGLVDKRIMLNSYLSVKDQNTYYCNGTDDDFFALYEMSKFTEGETYGMLQADFQNILRTIPTLYSSGVVVKQKSADCSSKQQSFYIPVDSYVQTIQLTYFSSGPMKTATLFKPDGTPVSDKILMHIIKDDTAGIYVDDVRKPCDPDWDFFSQKQLCLKKAAIATTWSAAQKICSNDGGFLVDDMFAEKNDYLGEYVGQDIWLGLNDIAKVGAFVWDRGLNRSGEPLATTHYDQWAPNQNLNDPTNKCVSRFQSDGKWHVVGCNQLRTYVCQKHKYSPDYTPNKIDMNEDLPVGKWRFDFQSNVTADGKPAGCMFEVRVQSTIQVYSGFSTDEHGDYPQDYPISGSNQNRFITHLNGKTNARRAPRLSYAMLYDQQNGTFYDGLTYEKRDLCAYPFVSQSFECPNYQDPQNAFVVRHTGEDEQGVAFQRFTSGHCRNKLRSCENGGLVWQGQCVCPDLYKGANCDTPICVNGGALDTVMKTCDCPKGFTGLHCELGVCYTQSTNYVTMKNDGKTFALVVENTQANLPAIKSIKADLKNIIDEALKQSPGWFNTYVLVTFDANGADIRSSGRLSQFIDNFNSMTASQPDASTGCQYPIYGSMMKALTSTKFNSPGSIVYLVTRGTPSDFGSMIDFANTLSDKQAHFYLTSIIDKTNCASVTPDSYQVKTLSMYAYGSDGNVFFIDSGNLGIHMQNYIPYLYDSQVLATPTFFTETCEQLAEAVLVDRSMDVLIITIHNDPYSTFELVDTFGNIMTDYTSKYIDANKDSIIYTFNVAKKPGIYTININSSAAVCLVQIRGQHGVQVYSGFIYGESEPTHQDDPKYGPALDVQNTFVAHAAPFNVNKTAELTYVEIFDMKEKNGFVSPLYLRYNCSFEYYSNPFTCPGPSFFVVIYGIDQDGQTFRRSSVFECPSRGLLPQTSTPAIPVVTSSGPTPPVTTTTVMTPQNIPFDVFLFVDTSDDVNKTIFEDNIVNFVMNTFQTFDMARSTIKFAIYSVEGTDGIVPHMTLPLTQLGVAGRLHAAMSDLGDAYFGTTTGQSLMKNLDLLTDKNMVSDPSYNLTSNKVAIYLTATATPSQDAIDKAKALRKAVSNKIGFISVAYPSDGSNKAALSQLSGGDACTFVSNDFDEFFGFTASIYELIWKAASSTNGRYC